MDGKFTNTEIVTQLDTISNTFKDRLQNPFYNFMQEKGTVVTYYNLDIQNYPLDKVTGMQYASIGSLSNNKYNKIHNFVLYGIDKMPTTIEDTEEGTEGAEVNGNAFVLPNTIEPYPGDFFTITYMEERLLFRVIEVQGDTFNNGSNLYQIDYKLEHVSDEEINQYNIGLESQFLLNNVGTKYTSVLENTKFEVVRKIEVVTSWMKKYYKNLFYEDRVQALIFHNSANNFYDSFLTEFVIKNKLLSERNDYIYIAHQLDLPNTFALDYSRSFFQCIEDKSSLKFKTSSRFGYGELIENKTNIFSNRPEPYLSMTYKYELAESYIPGNTFEIFDTVLLQAIADNELIDGDILSNMVVKYFNDTEITQEDLNALETFEYKNCAMQFYYVPIVIFILEKKAEDLLAVQTNK